MEQERVWSLTFYIPFPVLPSVPMTALSPALKAVDTQLGSWEALGKGAGMTVRGFRQRLIKTVPLQHVTALHVLRTPVFNSFPALASPPIPCLPFPLAGDPPPLPTVCLP